MPWQTFLIDAANGVGIGIWAFWWAYRGTRRAFKRNISDLRKAILHSNKMHLNVSYGKSAYPPEFTERAENGEE